MRVGSFLLSSLATLSFCLVVAAPIRAAMDPQERARRDMVIAKVGPRTITAGELEDRLAAVPRFQLQAFGDTPDAIRHRFLNEIVIPETLYSIGAEAEHLDRMPQVALGLTRARSNATIRAVRAQAGPSSNVSAEEVRKYYEDNKSRYDTPERYSVWRILCRTREEAVAVLEAAKKDLSIPNFTALARDHSLDQATHQRGGNVGFLAIDGTSNESGVKVDPSIAKAAASVRDGELVPQPVAEGASFAVVWHRGTVPAVHRKLAEVSAQIQDTVWKRHEEQTVRKLVADLRQRTLKELNEGLLNGVDISPSDGEIVPRRRPGQVAPLAQGRPMPK